MPAIQDNSGLPQRPADPGPGRLEDAANRPSRGSRWPVYDGSGTWGGSRMLELKRREFIALLGGGVIWPLAAHAQQAGSIPRIGVLWPGDAPPVSPRMESFRQGLRASGFVDGQNIAIELRYAQRGPQQLPELAAELARLKVDVIFASGDLAPKVAQQATETIPIVAIGDDILGAGLITSLSRPGGNTTGLTILSPELSAKRLEIGRAHV